MDLANASTYVELLITIVPTAVITSAGTVFTVMKFFDAKVNEIYARINNDKEKNELNRTTAINDINTKIRFSDIETRTLRAEVAEFRENAAKEYARQVVVDSNFDRFENKVFVRMGSVEGKVDRLVEMLVSKGMNK